MESNQSSGAIFSRDRQYRYVLWRAWDPNKPAVMFIGLNPSRGDEQHDDPTIRRIKKLARDWGFGKLIMTNLYAYITPYPADLFKSSEPIGSENDHFLKEYGKQCRSIVFAWGKQGNLNRVEAITRLFPNARCLGRNLDGTPKHPLYVRKNSKLHKWS